MCARLILLFRLGAEHDSQAGSECLVGNVLQAFSPSLPLLLHLERRSVVSVFIRSSVESLDFPGPLSLPHNTIQALTP